MLVNQADIRNRLIEHANEALAEGRDDDADRYNVLYLDLTDNGNLTSTVRFQSNVSNHMDELEDILTEAEAYVINFFVQQGVSEIGNGQTLSSADYEDNL